MVSGEWTVHQSSEAVWKALTHPEQLVHNIANVIDSKFYGNDKFWLAVDVDTGLGAARYNFDAVLSVLEQGRAVQVTAHGSSSHNVVDFTTVVRLHDAGAHTKLAYTLTAKASGGLASVAQRTVADVIVRHVMGWLRQALGETVGEPA